MPFAEEEIRLDLACRREPDGHWRGTVSVSVDARALWRLGLHPDQPSSLVDGPSPPAWWHAAGQRYATRRQPVVKRHAS
ncbi:hypothetical protein AQI88_29075 [Streptomyces cellostaticus]|uniref:Uncharacterized protein n=1 Tax=Streptomyces cellostaticus TaxID=67285 RepID=A0A101NH46_9ACTN|nr:hypothetical protein [Streptomyces cellostaticus]KUM92924.1 hypothetical protein AQI88_29075 [Streptomyces cellostaticus]GHI04735.1 hypothetical protein Scel_30560 [Streptomyces cellostaticus]